MWMGISSVGVLCAHIYTVYPTKLTHHALTCFLFGFAVFAGHATEKMVVDLGLSNRAFKTWWVVPFWLALAGVCFTSFYVAARWKSVSVTFLFMKTMGLSDHAVPDKERPRSFSVFSLPVLSILVSLAWYAVAYDHSTTYNASWTSAFGHKSRPLSPAEICSRGQRSLC